MWCRHDYANHEIKYNFDDDLVAAISSMFTNDHLFLLGSFKALVESDCDVWPNCNWKFRALEHERDWSKNTGTRHISPARCNRHFLFHQSTLQSVVNRPKIRSMTITCWRQGAAPAKTNALSQPLRQCCQNIFSWLVHPERYAVSIKQVLQDCPSVNAHELFLVNQTYNSLRLSCRS